MRTKEERYEYLLSTAEDLFGQGDDERAGIALALCQEIRMGMRHSWDESLMTPEAVAEALRGTGKKGESRSALTAVHGTEAVSKAIAQGKARLVQHGSGFRVVSAEEEGEGKPKGKLKVVRDPLEGMY